ELQVTARVRSEDVAHALEGLRGERGFRGDDARFTWAGRSRFVRVQAMRSTTTASRSRAVHLQLEAREADRDPLGGMSVNGRSAAELTELALRAALFGERNPLEREQMGFFAKMPDPLEALREARVPDEVTRPLAELVIVDALVGSGRAARVTE